MKSKFLHCKFPWKKAKVKISKGETGLKAYKYNNRSSCRLLHDSMIITVIARLLFAKEIIDVLMAVGEVGLLPLLLNSVINPIIYTEKKKNSRLELPSSSCCQEKFSRGSSFRWTAIWIKGFRYCQNHKKREDRNESDKLEHNSNNNDNNSIR